jgi:hypothetical protein
MHTWHQYSSPVRTDVGIPTYFRNAVFDFCLFGIVHWSRTYTQCLADNDINYSPTTLQNQKLLFRFCLVDNVYKYVPNKGYTIYDQKTNGYIRHELQITGILDKIDEYRRNWFQHLQIMPQNRIPLKSYYYRPQGRRTIGRPKKRWRDQL